jgi:acyl-CoA hydrolase
VPFAHAPHRWLGLQVGCTVTAQTPQRPETRRQICNAYFTFLSNDENKKPLRLAPVIPETYALQVGHRQCNAIVRESPDAHVATLRAVGMRLGKLQRDAMMT